MLCQYIVWISFQTISIKKSHNISPRVEGHFFPGPFFPRDHFFPNFDKNMIILKWGGFFQKVKSAFCRASETASERKKSHQKPALNPGAAYAKSRILWPNTITNPKTRIKL